MTNDRAKELLRRKGEKLLAFSDSISISGKATRPFTPEEKSMIRLAALDEVTEFLMDLQRQYLNGISPDDMGRNLDSFMTEYSV